MSSPGRLTSAWRGGYEGRAGWWFSFQYDADKVEELKAAIPHIDRTWDSYRKLWWAAIEYEDTLFNLWPEFESYKSQLAMF